MISLPGAFRTLSPEKCHGAVEAAGDVDTLLLDKTGTITLGKPAGDGIPAGARRDRSGTRRCVPSLPHWPTKLRKGRSIVRTRQGKVRHPQPRHGGTQRNLRSVHGANPDERPSTPVPRRSARARSMRSSTTSVAAHRRPLASWEHRARHSIRGEFRRGSRDPGDFGRGSRKPAETPLAVAKDGRPFWASSTSRTSSRAASASAFAELRRMGHPHRDDHRRQSD